MIPIHIIEKAIAGGWKKELLHKQDEWMRGENGRHVEKNFIRFIGELNHSEIALDPDFWMALGKEMGWEKGKGKNHDPVWMVTYNVEEQTITEPWTNWAMEFQFLILCKASQEEIDNFWKWKNI